MYRPLSRQLWSLTCVHGTICAFACWQRDRLVLSWPDIWRWRRWHAPSWRPILLIKRKELQLRCGLVQSRCWSVRRDWGRLWARRYPCMELHQQHSSYPQVRTQLFEFRALLGDWNWSSDFKQYCFLWFVLSNHRGEQVFSPAVGLRNILEPNGWFESATLFPSYEWATELCAKFHISDELLLWHRRLALRILLAHRHLGAKVDESIIHCGRLRSKFRRHWRHGWLPIRDGRHVHQQLLKLRLRECLAQATLHSEQAQAQLR